MIISRNHAQILKVTPPNLNWYLKQVSYEELIFRVWGVIGIQFLSGWWVAIIITTVIWSLLHLLGFKWQMIVATMVLGIGFGWSMVISWLPCGLGSILTFAVHLLFGWGGYKLGIIQKWIKE